MRTVSESKLGREIDPEMFVEIPLMPNTKLHPKQPNSRNPWKRKKGDFPGGPMAKTPRSKFRGPKLDPWSRN